MFGSISLRRLFSLPSVSWRCRVDCKGNCRVDLGPRRGVMVLGVTGVISCSCLLLSCLSACLTNAPLVSFTFFGVIVECGWCGWINKSRFLMLAWLLGVGGWSWWCGVGSWVGSLGRWIGFWSVGFGSMVG